MKNCGKALTIEDTLPVKTIKVNLKQEIDARCQEFLPSKLLNHSKIELIMLLFNCVTQLLLNQKTSSRPLKYFFKQFPCVQTDYQITLSFKKQTIKFSFSSNLYFQLKKSLQAVNFPQGKVLFKFPTNQPNVSIFSTRLA